MNEKCGADIGTDNGSPLHMATRHGHLNIIKYFVEKHNRALYILDRIYLASMPGHLNIVKYFVEKCGAHVREYSDLAIRVAFDGGHLEVVTYLLEHGACRCPYIILDPKYQRFLFIYEKK